MSNVSTTVSSATLSSTAPPTASLPPSTEGISCSCSTAGLMIPSIIFSLTLLLSPILNSIPILSMLSAKLFGRPVVSLSPASPSSPSPSSPSSSSSSLSSRLTFAHLTGVGARSFMLLFFSIWNSSSSSTPTPTTPSSVPANASSSSPKLVSMANMDFPPNPKLGTTSSGLGFLLVSFPKLILLFLLSELCAAFSCIFT